MVFRFWPRGADGVGWVSLPRGVTIALISIVCVAVVGIDLYKTWDGRSREINDSRREVANLALSAAQHAEDAFQLADASLVALVELAEVSGFSFPQDERIRHLMARQMATLPMLQNLTLIDADGDTIIDSHPVTPRISVADRAFFQYHLTHSDLQPRTSELLHSRVTGNWVIALSRRINHADGSFAGVVTATIDVRYFQQFYATFDLLHDGSASLLLDDGQLLVRQPFIPSVVGSDQHGSQLFTDRLRYGASGTFEATSRIDGVARLISYRRVNGFPLVVAVSLGLNEELATWSAGATMHVLVVAAVVCLLLFLGVRLARQIRLLEQAEQLASASNVTLDRLARHIAKARDRAEQANQAKSRFLTGITHELRTPLHGILGYAELLSLEGGLNPTQAERVAAMIAAGEHLLGMINAVLDVSQIEADRVELHPVEIELLDFARACLDVVRPAAAAKSIALVLSVAAPGRLFADPTRLRQVLINLLGNAIKFTPSGSVELRLATAESGASVRLEVIDTGPAIPAADRDKLFQTFERLNAEAVGSIEGAGLGLALTARLAERMGGRVGYADNPGGGSVFWVELSAISTVPVAVQAAVVSPRIARPGLRVLVVDDDALNRSIASGFLRFGGHEVVCLDNGATAVEAAEHEDFDVILMDVRMPGMNGLEATRRIRALPGARGKVPVIALTAQAFAEQIEICRQAGMNTHVSKPFRQEVLLAAVELMSPEPATGPALAEPEVAVFDRAAFETTASFLSADEIQGHLRALIVRCETMLRALRGPELAGRAIELAETAHAIAGSAGTLSFLLLARAGIAFEVAADSGAANTVALGGNLADATEVAIAIMRRELAGVVAVAA